MVLGKGAYGTVRLFRHKATGTPLAVKSFTLPSDPDQMVRRVQAIQDETDVQAVLGKRLGSVIIHFHVSNIPFKPYTSYSNCILELSLYYVTWG